MKKDAPRNKSTVSNCGCTAKDASMHKLLAMGQNPKFVLSGPKTPA